MGMMRFKSEEEFIEFQKKTGVKEAKLVTGRKEQAVQVQACRPEDRAILKTEAGQQMLQAAVKHLRAAPPPGPSQIHIRMRQQIQTAGLPEPVEEYYHIKGRDFRLDFAWPDRKIGLEVQGMAHRIKGKFHADIEKRALAMLDGWRVLEVSGDAVRDERGIGWLKQLMGDTK